MSAGCFIIGKVSECLICEIVIGSLQGLSSDKHAEVIIHDELVRACEKFPKYYQQCLDVMLQLAPQIEAISRAIPPSFICSHLKVCDYYGQNIEILKSDGCKDGPEFWCASTVHAASCGTSAIEYCQKNIWKGEKPRKNPVLSNKMLIAPLN